MNRIRSKAKCPKCGSKDLCVTELWEGHYIVFDQFNGEIGEEGYLEPGEPYKVLGTCHICKHAWRFRNISQVVNLHIQEEVLTCQQ